MLELAAEMQEQECGDATNLTVSFAGELLKLCEDLLRMGLHTSEIVMGYKKAYEFLEKVRGEGGQASAIVVDQTNNMDAP